MTLAELQALARQGKAETDELRLEIAELHELGVKHRQQIARQMTEIEDLRRRMTRQRSQIEQLVTFATTTDEFRRFIIERVWISGASDKDMVMAMIAAMPEVKS
jgi:chromosome segregation ATPase